MNDDISWLITVLFNDELMRYAVKFKRKFLPGDCADYPMEPENRKLIHDLLPDHIRSLGPIVAIDGLFDVYEKE